MTPDPDRVREALEFLDGWDIDAPWVDAACMVLRAWLNPDIEAAVKPLRAIQLAEAEGEEGLSYYKPYELEALAEAVVAAALGLTHE